MGSKAIEITDHKHESKSPKVGEKLCRHRQRDSYCQLTNTNKCCACLEKSRRYNPKFDAKTAAAAVVCAADSQTKYASYCDGCVAHHKAVDAQVAQSRAEAFAKWRRRPGSDPERTKLHANFVLRYKVGLPFEITHLVLAFTLKQPLVHFFRFFDKQGGKRADPGMDGIVISQAEAQRINVITPQRSSEVAQRASKCTHAHCSLVQQIKSCWGSRHFMSHYKSSCHGGCCACRDARPNPCHDVRYIDGRGNVLKQVDFYQYYCSSCQDYWKSRPNENPHVTN